MIYEYGGVEYQLLKPDDVTKQWDICTIGVPNPPLITQDINIEAPGFLINGWHRQTVKEIEGRVRLHIDGDPLVRVWRLAKSRRPVSNPIFSRPLPLP